MHNYTKLFRPILSRYVKQCRNDLHLSQECMADRLHVSLRAYHDLEHGKYALSTPALIFLLLNLDDSQRAQLMQELQEVVRKEEGQSPQTADDLLELLAQAL